MEVYFRIQEIVNFELYFDIDSGTRILAPKARINHAN